jgi:hypothetical protein
VAHIRSVLEQIEADAPGTLLDLKRRLARELDVDPKPQALQGLAALRDVADRKGREIALRSAVLHFALELTEHETWNSAETDPVRLRCAVELIPPLIALTTRVEQAFDASIGEVDRFERDAIGRLHASLYVPEQPLFAAFVVVPEVARLAEAARNGSLADAAPSLTPAEIEVIVAASAEDEGSPPRPDRVLVDAIALRTLIARDLAEFNALALQPGGDEAKAVARQGVRRRLVAERMAHEFVAGRLEAMRSERFARTRITDRTLDRARRKLFAAYVDLRRALAGESAEDVESVRARILDAEREAAAVDAEQATQRELMRDATSGLQSPTPEAVLLLPASPELARERRRKRILIGVAASLLPLAVTANVVIVRGGPAPIATNPDFLASAMPVREIMPIGQALYSQVSTLLWDDLTEAERRGKVKALGRLAAERGFQAVLVVDDSRRERARWSLTSGTELAEDRRPN